MKYHSLLTRQSIFLAVFSIVGAGEASSATQADGFKIGDGYLATRLESVSRCFEPKARAKPKKMLRDNAATRNSSLMFDASTVEKTFGLQVGVGASYGLFSASSSTSSESQSALSSTGLVYSDIAWSGETTTYNASDLQLTNAGKTVLNELIEQPDSPDAYNSYIKTCGTDTVVGITTGKEAQFQLILSADSSSKKSSFKSKFSGGAAGFASVSTEIGSSNSENKKSIKVQAQLYQKGGESEKIWASVPSASNCSIDGTTGNLNGNCQKAIDEFGAYLIKLGEQASSTQVRQPELKSTVTVLTDKFPEITPLETKGKILKNLRSYIAKYNSNFAKLSDMYFDNTDMHEKLAAFSGFESDDEVTRNIDEASKLMKDLLYSTKDDEPGIKYALDSECNSGVCTDSLYNKTSDFVKKQRGQISPIVIGMQGNIISEISDISKGLVYRCNDWVRISFNDQQIKSVRFNGRDYKNNQETNIPGLCSTTKASQTLSGYLILKDVSATETKPEHVVPFFLNSVTSTDQNSVDFVISQALKVDNLLHSISGKYTASLHSTKHQLDGTLNPDGSLTFPRNKEKKVELYFDNIQ